MGQTRDVAHGRNSLGVSECGGTEYAVVVGYIYLMISLKLSSARTAKLIHRAMSSCTINLNLQAFLHHNPVSRYSEVLAAVSAEILSVAESRAAARG